MINRSTMDAYRSKSRWPKWLDFSDFRTAVERDVLPGFLPPKPLLNADSAILCQGSCFAEEVHKALRVRKIKSAYMKFGEEINSPLANRYLFTYALQKIPYVAPDHREKFPPEGGEMLRASLSMASCLILTLGLGFCPYIDGHLTFNILPPQERAPEWRLTTVAENVEHIDAIISAVREINPGITFILTVSPIPTSRSYTHESPFAADCLSKSTLRLAANEIMSRGYGNIYYWPAFEAIRWLSGHHGKVFGIEGEDSRHIGRSKVQVIIDLFIEKFFLPAPDAADAGPHESPGPQGGDDTASR